MSGGVDEPQAWALDESFRILAYAFRIRTTSETCAELLLRALGACRVADVAGEAPVYRLEDDLARSLLTRDDEVLFANGRLGDAYRHFVWQVMNHAVAAEKRFLVVHAGVVVAPGGGAVVLPAASGGGKTTLTAGLVRVGFDFLSDEMMAVDPETLQVIPVPRSLFVKPGTLEALELEPPAVSEAGRKLLDGMWPVTPDDLRSGSLGGAARVRTVVAPAYRAGSETEITPVSRATGLIDLATHAFNMDSFGGTAGVELLAEVVRSATCFRLAVGRLDEAVAAVVQATAGSVF